MNAASLPSRAPLTIAELAARWSYSEDTVRRIIRSGLLVASRIGPQRMLVIPEDAETFERYAISREPLDRDVVYFVQARHSKLIKIGRSGDARCRLQSLRVANSEPIAVLALCPGAWREQEFHSRFSKERCHGEWFKPSRRLRSVVCELKEAFGLPEWAE